jgi:UDP:flavonoid glycosyltransferase YjiC (YdhE family)
LALAAVRAGHEVRLATGRNIVEWARRCGLDTHAVGLSEDDLADVADRDFAGPMRTGHMFADVWIGAAIPDLLELTSAWRPDLVLRWALSGRLSARVPDRGSRRDSPYRKGCTDAAGSLPRAAR